MNSKRMLLRLLRLGLLSLLFVHQTTPALSIIEESVKELIVERRSNNFDSFTVKMKTDRTCNSATCTSLGALYVRFAASGSSCECQCRNYQPFTFLSSIQRCANTTQVHDFGGCDEYLNLRPILSFQTFPQQQPIDLIKASSVSLSAQATSCTFNQKYSVHDYSGFQSRWRTISNRFFSLSMTSGNGKFNLNAIITAVSSSSAISNDPGDKETKASGHDNGIVIGSAVGGGVVLGILVVLSIVICWKRRKPGSILVETPEYANPGTEIQLETTNESYTSPTAQDDQPTYQGLLNDNRQSNVAVNNSAESNYVNCPVYQTLNEKNPGTLVYQLPVYQSNGQPTNSSYEIQLETPKARTSPIAQDDQPTYQGLLSENRQSNLAATYNRAEGSYENCPVYHTLNKKNPGTPVYQSPVHQSKGLPGGASTGINEEQDGHGTQYEPLRRP